ncbi:MAG: hypothetical protein KIS66_06225 [Fimbriimonadaceae bacterium]|nr:hypothetical protein [Fimbriimonadaceae bacterium]
MGNPLLTPANHAELLAQALRVVPAQFHEELRLAAAKALALSREKERLDRELLTEEECQFQEWAKVSQSPRVGRLSHFVARRNHLDGQVEHLRQGASAQLARIGLRFCQEDLNSLEALQDALERNLPSEATVREKLGLPPSESQPSLLMSGISEASPFVFAVLTAQGFALVLTNRGLLEQIFSPITPFLVGFGLLLTLTTFGLAHGLGGRIASLKLSGSASENARSAGGALLYLLGVAIPTLGLFGLDVVAVLSLGANGDATAAEYRRFVPFITGALTLSGVVAKTMQGFTAATTLIRDQMVDSELEREAADMRSRAAKALELVAESDTKRVELDSVCEEIRALESELNGTEFAADVPESLLDDREFADAAWREASDHFWSLTRRRTSLISKVQVWIRSRESMKEAR